MYLSIYIVSKLLIIIVIEQIPTLFEIEHKTKRIVIYLIDFGRTMNKRREKLQRIDWLV